MVNASGSPGGDEEGLAAAEAALAAAEAMSSEVAGEANDLIDAICVFRAEGPLVRRVEAFDPWARRISEFLWGDETLASEVFECVCEVEGSLAALCGTLGIGLSADDLAAARSLYPELGGEAAGLVMALRRCQSDAEVAAARAAVAVSSEA